MGGGKGLGGRGWSYSYAFYFIEGNSVRAPIIEARGLGIGVAGHTLCVFELGVRVREVGRDAGSPEGVVADVRRFNSCLSGSSLDHS